MEGLDRIPEGPLKPRITMQDILGFTGASRSQAYAYKGRLQDTYPTLVGTPGRPHSPSVGLLDDDRRVVVIAAILEYVKFHPGAIDGTRERHTYSDGFRRFVVGLAGPGQLAEGMTDTLLASLAGVPLATLHDWLNPKPSKGRPSPSGSDTESTDAKDLAAPSSSPATVPADATVPSSSPETAPANGTTTPATAPATAPGKGTTPTSVFDMIRNEHQKLILALWPSWQGTFDGFCRMLRREHRLPFGPTFIGTLLEGLGLRHRKRRTPVEAPWSSNTFRRFFPGVQWIGDGTRLAIRWGDKIFFFNVEALIDVASNAMMGLDVSPAESALAVHHAYEEAKITSGGVPPVAVTLDNKACNDCPDVHAALADTILLHATPGRGQAKAPVEGAFGLASQDLPPLDVMGSTPEEVAACVVRLILLAYYRGRNGRPRKRLGNLTPTEFYANAKPTPEEFEAARKWCQELARREEKARQTREARLDPVRRRLLKEGLAEVGIDDPEDHLAKRLACFGREAIADGLAVYAAKRDKGTLPSETHQHGAYLGGIIKNLHTRYELDRFATHVLKQRIRMQDFTLQPLFLAADHLRSTLPFSQLPQAFVDRALEATNTVDYRFWTQAATQALAALAPTCRHTFYQALTRRISACFKADRERRADLISSLAGAVAEAA